MSYISALLTSWIGKEKSFATQLALATAAEIQPSTLNRTLRGASPESETLKKLLSCLTSSQQEQLIGAAIRDAIPEPYISHVLDENRFVVRDEAVMATLSPLAQETLGWLNKQAARDHEAQAWLEQLGRWIGLDKEMES